MCLEPRRTLAPTESAWLRSCTKLPTSLHDHHERAMLVSTVMLVFGNILALSETAEEGLSIAATGMLIVMLALTFISLFIAALPRILAAVAKVYPEPVERHAKRTHPEGSVADDEAVLAAIGFVLHTEFQKQLVGEKTGVNKG